MSQDHYLLASEVASSHSIIQPTSFHDELRFWESGASIPRWSRRLLNTVLLTALASIKRVADLQAFSVNESCLEFWLANSHVVLRPWPGYVPKVPTTPFRDQSVSLQALPSEVADPALDFLCPICALWLYVDST